MNEAPQQASQRVQCPAKNDPAVRLFIMTAMLVGFGIWCLIERHKYPPPEAWTLEHINDIANYVLNHWMPLVFIPAGVVFGVWGIVFLRRVLVADDEGIGYLGRDKIAWSDITEMDARLLASKGILVLNHSRGKLVLDSWKLKNFRPLVALIEQKLRADSPQRADQGESDD